MFQILFFILLAAVRLAGATVAGGERPDGFPLGGTALSMAFSPDGRQLAARVRTAKGDLLSMWVLTGRRPLGEVAASGGREVVFSPNSRYLASGDEGRVRIWAVRTGQVVREFPAAAGPAVSLAFRPDGKRLASAHGAEAWLWDVPASTAVRRLAYWRGDAVLRSVAFGPLGKLVAAAGYRSDAGVAALFGAENGEPIRTLKRPGARFLICAFSPDGRLFAAGGHRTGKASTAAVWLWRTRNWGKPAVLLRIQEGRIISLAFSPNGRHLAVFTAGPDKVSILDISGRRVLKELGGVKPGKGGAVAFSPSGKLLAVGGEGEIWLWPVVELDRKRKD